MSFASGNGTEGQPYLLSNGTALYYIIIVGPQYRLQRAAITGTSVQPPRDLGEINDGGRIHLLPTPSEDDLVLYFTDGSGSRDGGPTFFATRGDASAPFGPTRPTTATPDSGFYVGGVPNFASFISRDACRLYFHRSGDLFVARRTPHL